VSKGEREEKKKVNAGEEGGEGKRKNRGKT